MATPADIAARLSPAAFGKAKVDLLNKMLLVAESRVKRRTPVRSGRLRRSITRSIIIPGVRGRVGTNMSYAIAVHEGAKAYTIRPVVKKALYWKGAAHPVRRVVHPATKGNPYLTNGLRDSEAEFAKLAESVGAAFFSKVSGI